MVIIVSNSSDVVKTLIQRGADVNKVDILGRTCLHAAAQNNQCEVIQVLLDNKADVTATDWYGKTALDLTENKGYKKAADLLRVSFLNC